MSHGAAGAMDEQRLAVPHVERVLQAAQGSHADAAHHRRLRRPHPGRDRRDETGVDADVLGVEPARRIQEAGGEDALADDAARHAVTDRRDRPGPFRAEQVGKRRRRALHLGVAALALEGVPGAHTGELEPDQDLSAAWRRHRHLPFVHLLGAAEAVDHHRPHRRGAGAHAESARIRRRVTRSSPGASAGRRPAARSAARPITEQLAGSTPST
jgi:hypothetical protein